MFRRVFPAGLLAFVLLSPVSAGASQVAGPELPKNPSAVAPSASVPAQGERIDDHSQYKHCIALARSKPEEGWEEALAWVSLGGSDPARQCAAIALIGLRSYTEAASRLETLAKESHSPAKLRAGMLTQAGQAWLLASQPEKAYAAESAALALVPGAPDLLVDRAQALAEAKNYKDALKDLDQALQGDPDRTDALVFRAAARRILDDLPGAAADCARALALDPQNQDGWLESGLTKRLQGDAAGARQDWLKVLDIAPSSVAADSARRNLELLDVEKAQ